MSEQRAGLTIGELRAALQQAQATNERQEQGFRHSRLLVEQLQADNRTLQEERDTARSMRDHYKVRYHDQRLQRARIIQAAREVGTVLSRAIPEIEFGTHDTIIDWVADRDAALARLHELTQ